MKAAFPLLDKEKLAFSFSKSNIIAIYDDKDESIDYLTLDSDRNDALLFTKLLQIDDLKYIVCPHLSFMALKVLKEQNFEVLQSQGINFNKNIESYKNKDLKTLTTSEAFMTECGGGCSKCETAACSLN